MIKGSSVRKTEQAIVPLLLDRWSPRAMSGEPVGLPALTRLLDAARWAPSSMNFQPWRFLFALREGPHWNTYMDFLLPGNRAWAEGAGALVVFISRREFDDGRPCPTHAYDTGAAWQNLALQGYADGLAVHGIIGFDQDRLRRVLGVPEIWSINAMAVIGQPGDVATLPERYREREKPSARRPLSESAREGLFGF